MVHYRVYASSGRKPPIYQISWRATFLGQAFGFGLLWYLRSSPSWSPFGIYACILSFFHFSEYVTTAMINPRKVKLDSFLLNHSREYGLAAVGSWIEFLVERHFFPGLKEFKFITMIGLILCIGGELMRKGAMFNAGSNFNHIVQARREEGHVLVTSGLYALCRHPSYVGWFYWSIGTQLILVNPVCVVIYAYASWTFFDSRVYEEEQTLMAFFGRDYEVYMNRVPTGLPMIKGLQL
ncbi:Protein-S-isoprenylcysteine O-methyltransferase [Halotydeus destructor]|nr:Protein-S-isoprenylcysteine O-methyltransferase [Halotydeus destructor]